ncbi:EcoAI/FtnUII family type I restriction enzme subunit R [Paenibacillus gallinarum]|uniref:DEAD/DEAH box helicase family protein n=1 Tax=Paenibacillus gallinarum TaxID=2762232 RepID=A0ABR8T5R1_9BACL|nr:DEAD/DEAH box helicase family protein [Paenibacillus gallinarum]MBD7971095.1 DEAD/DEAH box helicase family protein [Paenibacillus gallinarum]
MKSKLAMTEEDIKNKYITPAIVGAGWDLKTQVHFEHSFTDGRVIVRGNMTTRAKQKRADYLLMHKSNYPLAIVEAKDNKHPIGGGMQQALEYAEILDIPYAYSSNGDAFVEHNRLTGEERTIYLHQFPSHDELWQRYTNDAGLNEQQKQLIDEPYYYKLGDKTPRYYQRVAINRAIDAIAKGQDRIMLVMATGTGKTYTAFQIIYRLWKAGVKKRVLFLADRNILVDQTMVNDFKPFEKVMTKVENRKLDSSYEIYLSLYHQLAGDEGNEPFLQFQPDFFDLIIIDEAHRGSAKEESRWRKVLEYFNAPGTTHIGLTATPKETKDTSNITYFGEPVYTYSLKQGIDDGFLAPYKVIRVGLDRDLEGYRPEKGKLDMFGQEIEDREYNTKDFDKSMVIDDRTNIVAGRVTEFLKKNDRFAKTIIFCTDIDHAERMRSALVNLNQDLVKENSKYIMRITGDNQEGKAQLDNFIDRSSQYPTIVTTSKLLTTGVDAKTCKLIVLDSNINSMTEFKQTIGRGTRLDPEYGKEYFTIIDFRNVSRLFADPEFDGNPEVILEVLEDDEMPDDTSSEEGWDNPETEGGSDSGDPGEGSTGRVKYRVNDVNVQVVSERVLYYDANGKLITENLIDYTKKNIRNEYATLESFLRKWNETEQKYAILDELKEQGVLLEALFEQEPQLRELDEFDLICHLAFDQPPLTKAERANNVKKRGYIYEYQDVARDVLELLLDKYMNEGIQEIDGTEILELPEFQRFGSSLKIVKAFGGKKGYLAALKRLKDEIYVS